ncbi:MAG: class I adenylate-forming enzyme family protein [Acidimicrobiales bacterium]
MGDFLTGYAQTQPDKPAVIDDRGHGEVRSFTFRELNEAANRLAHVFLDKGAGEGRTVVWCGQNSIGIVTAINACRKIGVTAVPLNYRLSADEAAYVTDHSDAVIAYVDAEFASLFAEIRDRIPKVEHVLVFDGAALPGQDSCDELVAAASTDEPPAGVPGAVMIYTSGTTGKPKGALRRGTGDPTQTQRMIAFYGYRPDDVYLTTGPLYHSGPGGFMGIGQLLGQTVVVQRKFNPEDWLRLLDTYRCTSTFSAPTPIRMICNLPQEVKDRYDRSSMRVMIANAAPWPFALKQQYVANFPPESLWEVYGSTEMGVNCILQPADQMRKPGSCGRPAPGVEIRLYDEQGNVVDGIGPDHTGELFVRSASMFADYYKQHDKYLEDQRDGWQTVGDIAYRDEEGFYYICDRKKDMIISGGMNVYPAEIEAALEAHPDIVEAAVFGIPSEEWGESVHAVVVPRPGSGLDEAAVAAHAKANLANYKVPRSVSFLDELPKTGSGKVLKRELRNPFWAGHDRRV